MSGWSVWGVWNVCLMTSAARSEQVWVQAEGLLIQILSSESQLAWKQATLLLLPVQGRDSTLILRIFQARGCPHIMTIITGGERTLPQMRKLHIQVWWSYIHSTALVFVQQSLLIQSPNSTFHPACFFPFEYLPRQFVTVWNQNGTVQRRNINYVYSSTTVLLMIYGHNFELHCYIFQGHLIYIIAQRLSQKTHRPNPFARSNPFWLPQ